MWIIAISAKRTLLTLLCTLHKHRHIMFRHALGWYFGDDLIILGSWAVAVCVCVPCPTPLSVPLSASIYLQTKHLMIPYTRRSKAHVYCAYRPAQGTPIISSERGSKHNLLHCPRHQAQVVTKYFVLRSLYEKKKSCFV